MQHHGSQICRRTADNNCCSIQPLAGDTAAEPLSATRLLKIVLSPKGMLSAALLVRTAVPASILQPAAPPDDASPRAIETALFYKSYCCGPNTRIPADFWPSLAALAEATGRYPGVKFPTTPPPPSDPEPALPPCCGGESPLAMCCGARRRGTVLLVQSNGADW